MITFFLIVFLFMICFVKFLPIYKKVSRMKKVAKNIPGPKPLPLFGNALSFAFNSYDSLKKLQEITKQYGPTTAIWMGSDLKVYISDKEDMKAILSSQVHLKKAKMYDFMLDWLGNGLATADGQRWKHNRKALTPTFHFKRLENYIDIFNSNFKILTNLLENKVGNDGLNIEVFISNCFTDILYESALRVKGDVQLNSNSQFSESQKGVKIGIGNRIYKYWLHPRILFNLSTSGKNHNEGLKYLRTFVSKIISEKKKILKEKLILNKEEDTKVENIDDLIYGKKNLAFIDLLLQIAMNSNSYYTDEDLFYEVNTFITAGHGTLTSTLSFSIYELAYNQDIQNKAVQEIEEYFGDKKRQLTFQDLQHFPYLEMVVKETLRLYPVTYLGRSINEDFLLPSGYTIPAGSSIIFDWIHLHKDPTQYSEPERFNPDHFLPEQCAQRHPYAFVPFSAGPRNCIGQKYAMISLKAGLIHLLQKYKFLPSEKLPKIKLGYAILLHSLTGVNVRIIKRYSS